MSDPIVFYFLCECINMLMQIFFILLSGINKLHKLHKYHKRFQKIVSKYIDDDSSECVITFQVHTFEFPEEG